jgi:hypothetical protein
MTLKYSHPPSRPRGAAALPTMRGEGPGLVGCGIEAARLKVDRDRVLAVVGEPPHLTPRRNSWFSVENRA